MKASACLAVLIILTVSLPLGATHTLAGPFGEIVVFGDSLSDNGNLLLVDGQPEPDPDFYWEGRLSNGPVWVEYLTDLNHFDANLTDRALGGAQTDGLIPPGLIQQVTAHIVAAAPPLSPTNLYVIWIGGNDFFNGDGDFQAAVDHINNAMTALVDNGALSVLILNLPDLGLIPDMLISTEAAQATAFSVNFNAELANLIVTFRTAHPGMEIYEFDANAFFLEVLNDPGAFGFINVTEPSPNFSVAGNFDGAGHLFWDDKHPTTAMHALIADRVFADVSPQLPSDTPDIPRQEDESATCFIQAMTSDYTIPGLLVIAVLALLVSIIQARKTL
jgi:phospholipase/lecithinase/hemolysin